MPEHAAHSTSKQKLKRALESELVYSFFRSPVVMINAAIVIVIVTLALAADFVAPQNPFDLKQLNILNSNLPPSWVSGGDPRFPLGTDDQGRDVFSSILFGARISLFVGFAGVLVSLVIGVFAGLLSGYVGGRVDAFIMRVADVQLSFPAILVALLVDGIARGVVSREMHDALALYVVVAAIGLSGWVQYARTVRSSTMVEKHKEYVQAARIIGLRQSVILFRHILPNVLGPVLVIATIQLAVAIITEATLSFLGLGVPATSPSLGTLIRIGNDYLFSGEWWITIFPGVTLAILVLSVNLLGDWLRDVLNPKLR